MACPPEVYAYSVHSHSGGSNPRTGFFGRGVFPFVPVAPPDPVAAHVPIGPGGLRRPAGCSTMAPRTQGGDMGGPVTVNGVVVYGYLVPDGTGLRLRVSTDDVERL